MKELRRIIFVVSLIFIALTSKAQVNINDYQLSVKKTTVPIAVDGKLEEEVWLTSDKADSFVQNFPTDSLQATSQSEVSVAFDDQFLYVGGKCYENSDKEHIIQSLRRDFNWPLNENFSIYFDPFNDFTNGFTFGITPVGVQREGLVTNGQDVSGDWDNKWYSDVYDAGEYWSFEFAIPLKSIRYNPESRVWNMIFLRLDLKNNERSTWAPVPQGYRPSSFAFAGQLKFEEPLPKAGANVSFIPFVTSGVSQNFEDNENTESNLDAGFDAKVAVSSSLNLDLTFNPDFSQVEVDQQVTNLNRFEIFFPERRQFFLENNDLFGTNGFRSSRPFFSRRIGINRSTVEVDGEEESRSGQVPIQYGARLSGKVGEDWRVGFLNMKTKKSEELALPSQMYTVGVVQRKLFKRSNLGLIVVNKQSLNVSLADSLDYLNNQSLFKEKETADGNVNYLNKSNTVYGADFNFRSADNKWESNIFYHRSHTPNAKQSNSYAGGIFIGFTERWLRLRAFTAVINQGYNAEVGFIRRTDIHQSGVFADVLSYPSSGKINNHGPTFGGILVTDIAGDVTDYNTRLGYQVEFLNTSRFQIEGVLRYEKLRRDFDPTRTNGEVLLDGSDYNWETMSIEYNTDRRKVFSFQGRGQIGGFYSGKRFNANGQLNYRYQPKLNIAMRVDYNNINMPEPLNDAEFWLLGPRVDLTFTDKLFLTTFVQYNEQANNVNINTRFQWRYKPASDFFLVYTDNYFPDGLGVKSRALILKINYWLNI